VSGKEDTYTPQRRTVFATEPQKLPADRAEAGSIAAIEHCVIIQHDDGTSWPVQQSDEK
jgi:hypothetical protein